MKYSIYLFTLLATLAIGCTKSGPDIPEEPEPFADAPWALDETLPVPIQFDSRSYNVTQTKGKIEDLENVTFGVLALDATKSGEWGPIEGGVTSGAEYLGPGALLLLNKKATIRTNKIGSEDPFDPLLNDNDIIVQFLDGTSPITYYYPVFSKYNYTFFAYHTAKEDNGVVPNVTRDGNEYFVTGIPIGERDIIWAKAEATDLEISSADAAAAEINAGTYKGFNSRYIRNARKMNSVTGSFYKNHLPKFEFEHLTSHIHFNVRAENAYSAGTFVDKLFVNSITLKATGLPTEAKLNVFTGELTATETADTGITLNDTPYCPIDYSAAGHQFGTGLFIVPTTTLTMKLTMELSEPNGVKEYVELTLPTPSGTDTPTSIPAGFQPGVEYTYTITIKSLENGTILVAIKDWIGYNGEYSIPQPIIE